MVNKIKIINVVGARPNFMKIAPLMKEYSKYDSFKPIIVHTGQHYDANMSDLFFNQLQIPKPNISLGVGSDSHSKQTAKIMEKFEDVCLDVQPDAVLVVGDVNSTMACSLVASKMGIKIIHLEAGLRSYDRTMPEEINRLVTDALADVLLTPSKDADDNLIKEGIPKSKIFFVGNIMIDTLFQFLPLAEKSQILDDLKIKKNDFILVTLHRPSNVDQQENLTKIINAFEQIQKEIKIIFPIHPRTRNKLNEFGLNENVKSLKNLILTDPIGYLDFQKLMINAKLVITDSGGIQEETTALKIPCITVRENTERPITVIEGSNEIVGLDMDKLLNFTNKALNNQWKDSKIPVFWDGKTGQRVLKVLYNYFVK
jgi:UDP-N-acetylglucosamine 2-epimerase (non-hydrolysing)